MNLKFGENIKRLRKGRELTQEALANALGVTAQSISKWECDYGYPDITQLPAIANFFRVTIDELLSNDTEAKEAERERFWDLYNETKYNSIERIDFVREYCRRYPNELYYFYCFTNDLSVYVAENPDEREKYMPELRDAVDKMLDSYEYRNYAIQAMVIACDKEEAEKWLKLAPANANFTRRSMMTLRCYIHNDDEKQMVHQALDSVENFARVLEHRYPDKLGAKRKAEYHRDILAVIRSFGKNNNVPDAWLGLYAYKQFVLAACLCGDGKLEEGKDEFLSAVKILKEYFAKKDEYLDTGSAMFAGLKADREWRWATDKDGERYKLYGSSCIGFFSNPERFRFLLESPRWSWFDSIRKEKYYTDTIKWLEGLETK